MNDPKVEDNDNDDDSDNISLSFRCLNCGMGAPRYYYYYHPKHAPATNSNNSSITNNNNSIQLTECQACHALVDPYMEREWILVLLDLVLLRQEAYRHVYWNRLAQTLNHLHKNSRGIRSTRWTPLLFVGIGVATCFLSNPSMLLFVRDQLDLVLEKWHEGGSWELFLTTRWGLRILMLLVSFVLYAWVTINILSNSRQTPGKVHALWTMIHAAIWLPLVAGGLLGTLVVTIWGPPPSPHQGLGLIPIVENLGWLVLMALWQISGLGVLLIPVSSSLTNNKKIQ